MSILIIKGQEYRITKGILRVMSPRDDILDKVEDPVSVAQVSRQQHVPADILIFSNTLSDSSPKYPFHMEWDNIAAVPISTYEHWLMKQIHPNARNKINKAKKSGVVVKTESMTRKLAEGIVGIFNETEVRRGKRYSYYGQDAEIVEREWSKDKGRSDFLVAYYGDEIIGFIQLVYGKDMARTSGTVAKLSHRDKSAMNYLIAKAVEVCAEKKLAFLVYGKYAYGQKGEDSLTDFKKNNGFFRYDMPQYYVPLNLRGKLGIALRLYRGMSSFIPSKVRIELYKIRSFWYGSTFRHKTK